MVELSGAIDLCRYTTADCAHVRAFKANTINSKFFILIPSEDPVSDVPQEVPFFLKGLCDVAKRQKVDLGLDCCSDLVFDSTDDLELVFGFDNV